MSTFIADAGPPVLVIVLGLSALMIWKAYNLKTRRERKVRNTDPLF